MEIKIHEKKLADNRQDSFWYYDDHIADVVSTDGTRTLRIEAVGEIRISFPDSDTVYRGGSAVKEALSRSYTDEDLCNIEFHNNNWLEISEIFSDGDWELLDIAGEYDEAIETAKSLLTI